MFASHTLLYVGTFGVEPPVANVYELKTKPGSRVVAKYSIETHFPLSEQSFGQLFRSHAAPSQPSEQRHLPEDVSQRPRREHSTNKCATSDSVIASGSSAHAGPDGHFRSEPGEILNSVLSSHTIRTRESCNQRPCTLRSIGSADRRCHTNHGRNIDSGMAYSTAGTETAIRSQE